MSFHLAYHRLNVDDFRLSKARNNIVVQYALVPAASPAVIDLLTLDTISMSGEPGSVIRASSYDLLAVRRADTPVGTKDLAIEGMLVERLRDRAGARGHILPAIVLTERMPAWSKMAVPGEILFEMRSAARA